MSDGYCETFTPRMTEPEKSGISLIRNNRPWSPSSIDIEADELLVYDFPRLGTYIDSAGIVLFHCIDDLNADDSISLWTYIRISGKELNSITSTVSGSNNSTMWFTVDELENDGRTRQLALAYGLRLINSITIDDVESVDSAINRLYDKFIIEGM